MKTEKIEYKDGATSLRGYLAYDDQKTGKRPGVLVMPEAFGLGIHAKERVERLAKMGYVAFGGDPYGNGLALDDLQEAIKHATPLFADPVKARQRTRAALDVLASRAEVDPGRLASIGFCMGGTLSLEAARDGASLKGVVTFHSGLATQKPAEAGKFKAKVLVNHGADDPLVPAAQVSAFTEEMTKAGVDWQFISYGGAKHSFTNVDADKVGNPGISYHRPTDLRSWKALTSFFEEIFAG